MEMEFGEVKIRVWVLWYLNSHEYLKTCFPGLAVCASCLLATTTNIATEHSNRASETENHPTPRSPRRESKSPFKRPPLPPLISSPSRSALPLGLSRHRAHQIPYCFKLPDSRGQVPTFDRRRYIFLGSHQYQYRYAGRPVDRVIK